MITARDQVRTRIFELEARLRREAERTVDAPAAHRGDSAWRKCDEVGFQAALAGLHHEHRRELGAMRAKLARQQAAIRVAISKR